MSDADIDEVVRRFANTAALAEQAGFDGVQVHAAHGYLLSQFLSPLTNRREDRWGGLLENRARLLVEIIRARVAPGFGVGVVGPHSQPPRPGAGADASSSRDPARCHGRSRPADPDRRDFAGDLSRRRQSA
ncbi:hypothetical protein [Paracoccus limosus]|uniref:oxidoreductase n=1 Tax=Paracoccus limosus TaxID=913252 RepID=UPI003CCE1783